MDRVLLALEVTGGAAIPHGIMNGCKHFISIKIDGLTTNVIVAEVEVMSPLSINTWADITDRRSFNHLRREVISRMDCGRSDKWEGCMFVLVPHGIMSMEQLEGDETTIYGKSAEIYASHTRDSKDLLLYLNAGTLSYYSNQSYRGLLKNGLEGEYGWFLSLYSEVHMYTPFLMECSAF